MCLTLFARKRLFLHLMFNTFLLVSSDLLAWMKGFESTMLSEFSECALVMFAYVKFLGWKCCHMKNGIVVMMGYGDPLYGELRM